MSDLFLSLTEYGISVVNQSFLVDCVAKEQIVRPSLALLPSRILISLPFFLSLIRRSTNSARTPRRSQRRATMTRAPPLPQRRRSLKRLPSLSLPLRLLLLSRHPRRLLLLLLRLHLLTRCLMVTLSPGFRWQDRNGTVGVKETDGDRDADTQTCETDRETERDQQRQGLERACYSLISFLFHS
jgi:hypothetical protein